MALDTKGDWGAMTRLDEARLNKRMHEDKGHKGLQSGRDFRWNCFRWRDETESFRKRFDKAFSGSPGSQEWFDAKFCQGCGRRWAFCECGAVNE